MFKDDFHATIFCPFLGGVGENVSYYSNFLCSESLLRSIGEISLGVLEVL